MDDSLDLQLWMVPKIRKQSKFESSGPQIIVELSPMFIGYLFRSLKFQNNLAKTNQIRLVVRLEYLTSVF